MVLVDFVVLCCLVVFDCVCVVDVYWIDFGVIVDVLVMVVGNVDMLCVLLNNFVDNVICYVGEGVCVDVLVCVDGMMFVFEVVDDGFGILEVECVDVWECFYCGEGV